jgi:hypothetical protein
MIIKSGQLFPSANPTGRTGKVIQFPLVRIIIAFLFLCPVFLLNKVFRSVVTSSAPAEMRTYFAYAEAIVFFFVFLTAYGLYAKFIEKRKAFEISSKLGCKEFGKGFFISVVLVGAVVAYMAVIGNYMIAGWNPDKKVVIDLFIKFMIGALLEEIIFRLIIFRLTEELLGTWIALIIQAVLFGFAHMANDNSTLFTSFSVIIVGGIIYTGAFMYTRRIWLVLGLHAGWNYFQSGIFGMPNSGTAYKGLIFPDIRGEEWITGGSWGIEASYMAILVVLIAGVYFIIKAKNANQIILPVWIRKRLSLQLEDGI